MENERDYAGRFIENDLGTGATMREQEAAGVDHFDTEFSAQRKVDTYRYGTNSPLPTYEYVGGSDGTSLFALIALCFGVFLGIPLLLASLDSKTIATFIKHVMWTVGPVGLIALPLIFLLAARKRKAVVQKSSIKKLALGGIVWFVLRTLSFSLMPFIDLVFFGFLAWVVAKARIKT